MTLDIDDLDRRIDDGYWTAAEQRALLAEVRRLRAERAEVKGFLQRLGTFREEARHAIRSQPENVLVQRLQDGANLGHEAIDLWVKLEAGDIPESVALEPKQSIVGAYLEWARSERSITPLSHLNAEEGE